MSDRKLLLSLQHVDVWMVNQDISLQQTELFLEKLSDDEKDRASTFYFEKDKRHFIASRVALRQILSKYLNEPADSLVFSYTQFEKPYLKNSEIHFNVSHSFGQALIAVGKHPLGVDIEWSLREVELVELAQRFFSKKEANYFLKLDLEKMQRSFFEIWTKKEAVIKAIGDGLSYPLDQFHVNTEKDDLQFEDPKMKQQLWTLKTLLLPESKFAASLAVVGKIDKVMMKTFMF